MTHEEIMIEWARAYRAQQSLRDYCSRAARVQIGVFVLCALLAPGGFTSWPYWTCMVFAVFSLFWVRLAASANSDMLQIQREMRATNELYSDQYPNQKEML